MNAYLATIEKIRARLLAQDEHVIGQIDVLYLSMLRRLIQEFAVVTNQIDYIRNRGITVTEDVLYGATRLATAIDQMNALVRGFNSEVTTIINSEVEKSIRLGIEEADELIRNSLPANLRRNQQFAESFLRFDDRALEDLIRQLRNRKTAEEILGKSEPEMEELVNEVFVDAIIRGKAPKDAAFELYSRFGIPYDRAQTSARTEIITAYRDGNLGHYQQSIVVIGWRWSATLDARTCPVCVSQDGKVFSKDTPFATHAQCRCSPLPVTISLRELGIDMDDFIPDTGLHGEEWFRAQTEKTQKKILGFPERKWMWEAYSSGQITLENLVKEFDHPTYGPQREIRSKKELIRLGILSEK